MRKYAFVLILSILLVFGCGKKDNSTFQKEFQDKPTTEQDTSKSESDEKEGKYLDKAITLTEVFLYFLKFHQVLHHKIYINRE